MKRQMTIFIIFLCVSCFLWGQRISSQETVPFEEKVWNECWDETHGWFDFTSKVWTELHPHVQMDYANKYQHWYAQQHYWPIEKNMEGGDTLFAMVLVPPGKFWMGAPVNKRCKDFDEQRHNVVISKPFWIGKYEVTQAQWYTVMWSKPSYFVGNKLPVECVSWKTITNEFLPSLGVKFHLPTEAQWEYACRAGVMSTYCFGNNKEFLAEYAWYSDNAAQKNHPVGQKEPNAFGIHDMHGNVWEWCFDAYASYPQNEVIDPKISKGEGHIIRSGSWYHPGIKQLHSAHRDWNDANNRSFVLGLRVVAQAE